MKTSELTGAELDFWVAMAEGLGEPFIDGDRCKVRLDDFNVVTCAPSREWEEAGPIIERERISLLQPGYGGSTAWEAGVNAYNSYDGWEAALSMEGPTPLIAAMRAYVASKFGHEVPDGHHN